MRRLIWIFATVALGGVAAVSGWAGLTHQVSYVVINGVSMRPLYHSGDLVVVAKQRSYQVGDIVAYRCDGVDILHRIVGGDATGFVTKGDNNQSTDPAHPSGTRLVGHAVLNVPAGGTWLRAIASPPALGASLFLLLMGSGRTIQRRRRRNAPVGKHASANRASRRIAAVVVLSAPRWRIVAALTATTGLLGIGLGVLAWTRPTTRQVAVGRPAARSMTFSYSATVPLTPAYEGTTVTSPEPLFRRVVKTIDVAYAYTGPPGHVRVEAQLAIANGWHATVLLAANRSFTTPDYRGVVRLDLDALEARAAAGAKAIGVSTTDVGITIMPKVTTGSGTPFAPTLRLRLSPLLVTADGSLVATDTPPVPKTSRVRQALHLAGHTIIPVSTARIASGGLGLCAVLGAAILLIAVRRYRPAAEDAGIRQRYRSLLVEVEPMIPLSDRPVVQVTGFAALVRLAERYGHLILYWSTAGSATFTVQDDAATYWYSTGTPPVPAVAAQAPAPAQPPATMEPATAASDVMDVPRHWELSMPDGKDDLTELASRSLFEQEVQFAIDTSDAGRLCLMLVCIDGFASVAAEHGESAGNALLITIAERLRRTVRPHDLVSRLDCGGFAVLFENVVPADVDAISKRIMRSVSESVILNGHQIRVQTNMGVAQGSAAMDATMLMAHATEALIEAKAETDEQVIWFAEATPPQTTPTQATPTQAAPPTGSGDQPSSSSR